MATSNSTLSPIERNTDFAAELLINRVMNGQLETINGKTINAASRLMATRHDATAFSCDVLAENVAWGKTIVQGTQNALTELVDQVKKIRETFSVDDASVRNSDIASSYVDQLNAILQTEVNGLKVLNGSGTGLDLNIGINSQDFINIGNANVLSGSAFSTLYTNLSITSGSDYSTISDYCDKAIEELYGAIANQGVKYKILDNRYVMLNDLASSYHDASDDQAVNMGGSMSVLNAFS
ncbi:MAG: hypothetical protein IJU40_06860 [Desulfovibrionaceae bacterium]|nr:hypothetical protein [Desulfovibrionaceae bacterium]